MQRLRLNIERIEITVLRHALQKNSRNRLKFVLVTRSGGNQVDAGTRKLQEATEGFTGDPD